MIPADLLSMLVAGIVIGFILGVAFTWPYRRH